MVVNGGSDQWSVVVQIDGGPRLFRLTVVGDGLRWFRSIVMKWPNPSTVEFVEFNSSYGKPNV